MCIDWDSYKPTNDLNLQALKEVIKSGRAIAFIGAGCSVPLGYPSWVGLVSKMLDEIARMQPTAKSMVDMLRKDDDLLYVAGTCKMLMGPEYYPFMGREFAPKAGRNHTSEHEVIIKLPFYNYITSNYDSCLESAYAFIKNIPPLSVILNNIIMLIDALNSKGKLISHIHGRYDDPDTIVLTEDDYNYHYQEGFINSLLSAILTRPIVFIGSGVNDMDFLGMMRFIDILFKRFQERHYAIIPYPKDGYAEYEANRLLMKYNIVPVFYENPNETHTEREGILRDILSYCEDTTVKKSIAVKISQKSKEHELEQYKLRLNVELTSLRILEMSRPLNLLDIYIKTRLYEKNGKKEQTSKSMFIEEALKGYKKVVILGDPGAGKTTMLKHVTLQLADKGIEGVKGIPIFVTLRDYINKFKPDLLDYLDEDLLRRYGFNHARKYLEGEFKSGNVALFFDGLDEVSANYNKVIEVINNVATKYANCYIAVTCRKAGWRGGIKESFKTFEVLGFTPADITNFVEKWFLGETEKARELNRELARRERIKSIIGNPLLLSFVCILYSKLNTFPERRLTLYERCVNVLLNDWDESRGIERRSIFDQEKKKQLLQEIAYRFFIAGKNDFNRDELIRAIEECLPVLYLKQEDAADILQEISANHGLLKEQPDGLYGFIHVMVQEYFAACEIYDRRDYKIAIENSFNPFWEEVTLLLAGIGNSTKLIKGIFEKTDDIFDHNLRFAGSCLAEKPTLKGDTNLRSAILKKLRDVVNKSKYKLNKDKAINVLAENGEFDFLLGVLSNKKTDLTLRYSITDALGKLADSSIVADLMVLLRDEKTDVHVRGSIADALGKIADPGIVPELMVFLLDKKTDINVRYSIADALGKIVDSSVVPQLLTLLRYVTGDSVINYIAYTLDGTADSGIVAGLVALLRDGKTDVHVRGRIAEALGNIGDSSIVAELMDTLQNDKADIYVRGSIADVLGKIGDSSIVAELMTILRHGKVNSHVGGRIAEALGKIADSSIVADLMAILHHKKTDNSVRSSIAKALGNIGDSGIVADLMAILRNEKTNNSVRASIAEALGNIGNSSIVAELMPMMDDVESGIWDNIVQVIGKLGNTKEHCMGLLKIRSMKPYNDTLHTAIYQVSHKAGVVIEQNGNILEI
ncbi:signal transduction protein with Nacht domain protein [Candidatus Magnetobacterium bavaricum]|uniref:Signal transduction protein with Nacht domain protein n=1 Tax=Candidatus Magnetobacterium bavaricum TaxID=29290 RepID=A0A0F3GHL0_9BACT|nr:signal transduction protein with Nacht domain protein [Candidatus Magnetobacterium bavaricum]